MSTIINFSNLNNFIYTDLMHKSIHSLQSVEKWLHFEEFWEVSVIVVKYLLLLNNLFVTSKIEFSNPPILEFKVLHKSQTPCWSPLVFWNIQLKKNFSEQWKKNSVRLLLKFYPSLKWMPKWIFQKISGDQQGVRGGPLFLGCILMNFRGGPLFWGGCMLMNFIDGPPFCGWMLMNSRGWPPI